MPKILIADDIQVNRKLLTAILKNQKLDYDLIEAVDGADALAKATSHAPDIILLDVMMPRMNGFQVCKALKENKKTQFIPVIMITALSNLRDRVKGLDAGADDFLSKPIRREELMARLKSLLKMRELHSQLEESHRTVQRQKEEIQKKNDLLSEILNRYLSEEVSAQIISNPDKYLKLGGESRKITTLFADIRGFTAFSNVRSPTEVVSALNQVFDRLTRVVFAYKGTLDKFLGDGMMVFYGAPISYKDDAFRALKTASALQLAFGDLQKQLNDPLFSKLGLGVGVNTGDAVVGNIGSEHTRMDYTVIADSVNIASRLESIAQKGEIIISQSTYDETSNRVIAERMPPKKIKGIIDSLTLYHIVQILD
ncbi:MAG: hypothetical protein B6244_07750 [Candidatus Cloacimonetes bacterium 4572_55]|nr:MAG: hypothetical protein B6244_07750 [Candidatus Cloacimonetes bacterium 4572_55]